MSYTIEMNSFFYSVSRLLVGTVCRNIQISDQSHLLYIVELQPFLYMLYIMLYMLYAMYLLVYDIPVA